MVIKIRKASSADSSVILNFIRELAEFEKLAHEVKATETQLRKTLFEEDNGAEVVIAEVDSKPVGYALFFKSYSTFLAKPGIYLEDLYVTPSQRSAGIGRKLLKYLAQICIDRNYGRLEWSVLDWNERAIKFYRGVGAQGMDEWTVQRLDGAALKNFVNS